MKISKILRRIFLILGILILLLIGALVAIPIFFKDAVLETVKETVNENLEATVDFADVNLTFFRSFPDLTLQLLDYEVVGRDSFDQMTLAKGTSFDLSFQLWSVILANRPIELRSIHLKDPTIRVLVLKNGQANYDIAKPSATTDTTTTETTPFEIQLARYSIENGTIEYLDRSLDMEVRLAGLNHEGSGNLTNDLYQLSTTTDLAAFDLSYEGISYLQNAKLNWNADLEIDLGKNIYKLLDNELQLNALRLDLNALVGLPDAETVDLDIAFNAPGSDFRELFSLIPNAFIEGYETVKVDGDFTLAGSIKGAYRGDSYPAIDIQSTINNGAVQYPDLPVGINKIGASVDVKKPQGGLDQLVVNIPTFNLQVGTQPIAGRFYLDTPMSDPNIDMFVQGKLDLAQLNQAFPMEGVNQLAGLLDVDVKFKTKLSAIEKEQYEQVDVQGKLQMNQIVYQGTGLPKIVIQSAQADFSPQRVVVNEFNSQLGKSDLKMRGSINNLLAYFSPDKNITGSFEAQSSLFDADEWMYAESPSTTGNPPATNEESASGRPFDRFNFDFAAQIDRLIYSPYELKNMKAQGSVSGEALNLTSFYTEMGESDFSVSGRLDHLFDYLYEDQILVGTVQFNSNNLDLNPFLVADPNAAPTTAAKEPENLEPVPVPDNLDIVMNANIKRVQYTDIELKALQGEIQIVNQEIDLKDCTAKGMGGTLGFSGSYNTSDLENPTFDFLYNLQSIDFQKAFQSFNSFAYLAPIGKYIDGNLNSNMAMSGVLGKDMYPKMNTISADGFLETLDGAIKGYPPLEKVSQTLNLDLFERLSLEDTRNWFTVRDGKVQLKDTKMTKEGIDMVVGGTHGFDQSMAYYILAKVPREKLDNNALGDLANSGINTLRNEAGKLGIQWEQSEFINLRIDLTGAISNPKVQVKVLGGEGDVSLADAAKQEAKEKLGAEKAKLEAEAKQRLDEEKAKLEEELKKKEQEAKEKAKEEINKKTEEIKTEAKEKIDEAVGKQGQETIDDIKNKLENYNPFKKKKGGN